MPIPEKLDRPAAYAILGVMAIFAVIAGVFGGPLCSMAAVGGVAFGLVGLQVARVFFR